MSTADFDVDFLGNFDENSSQSQDQDQEKDKSKSYDTVQLVDQITAIYKNGNSEIEQQEQEEKISMARQNVEGSMKKSEFESETAAAKKKREMSNKRVKMGGILILAFLLLNFVLVVIVMSRTSEMSSSSSLSTRNFSAAVNQTHKTGKMVDELKFELDGIENWINSTGGKFESHQVQIESLRNQTKIDKQLEALEQNNRELKKSHQELKEQFESLSQKLDQLENPQSITSCSVAMEILPSPRSKKQKIYPYGNGLSLKVLCDFESDGGGWTIIQKRTSGPKQEFKQNWNEYVNGFGSVSGNFWMGLENIRALTKNGDQELRIDLEDFEGNKKYAKYSSFSVSDASDFYRLTLTGFYTNSTLGDSLAARHNGKKFTTIDRDNGNSGENCAVVRGGGGWWFDACTDSNLNGLYFEKGETAPTWTGIHWFSWKGGVYSLAKSEMKIRTRK